MAEERDNDQEKTEEPSQHRIDEFRKKGDIATSRELSNVILLSGTLLTLILCSAWIYECFTEYLDWILKQDPKLFYEKEKFFDVTKETAWFALKCIGPVFTASVVLGFASQILQVGFLYSPEILTVNFDRINPINGFSRIFSKKALVETVKGLIKFTVVTAISYKIIKDYSSDFLGFLHSETPGSLLYGKTLIIKLGFSILMGLGIIALLDFAWEKYSYMQKISMTKQEVKDEAKDKDGNPEIKNRIRQIQKQMSQKRMMNDVKKADVIITNPTHISVALKYIGDGMVAPEVVAKGADHLALKIRELAKEHDIPIVENVNLARTLYKTVKVGHGVPRSLYRAVAEILAFVYKLKKQKKAIS